MLNLILQDPVAEELTEEQSLSILDLLISGGVAGVVVIGILFVLLFVAVYIYFERFLQSNQRQNTMHLLCVK